VSIATTINQLCPDPQRLDPDARLSPREYWNARAARYATRGEGLAAVCAFGMPAFYNWYIHLLQHQALAPWLAVPPESRVLEIGCGVGRWTRRLARAGGHVVGFDLSRTMIDDARRRAQRENLGARCRFFVADCAEFSINEKFERILGVTVLQHVVDARRFAQAIDGVARHLAPTGKAVLLEAAPTRATTRCDSAVFVAREEGAYVEAFRRAGLHCVAVCGVDPAPFRTWFLPWFGSMPRPLGVAGMLGATLAGVPIDLLCPAHARARSWHKVFVLEHASAGTANTPDQKPAVSAPHLENQP